MWLGMYSKPIRLNRQMKDTRKCTYTTCFLCIWNSDWIYFGAHEINWGHLINFINRFLFIDYGGDFGYSPRSYKLPTNKWRTWCTGIEITSLLLSQVFVDALLYKRFKNELDESVLEISASSFSSGQRDQVGLVDSFLRSCKFKHEFRHSRSWLRTQHTVVNTLNESFSMDRYRNTFPIFFFFWIIANNVAKNANSRRGHV